MHALHDTVNEMPFYSRYLFKKKLKAWGVTGLEG